jgi:hypothetical protein
MYAHERSLVKRLESKPFVLLGVNSDENQQEVQKLIERERIPMRSWWEGPNRTISVRWRIESWPTLYVLDGKGVIRYNPKSVADLDRAVDVLLAEK